MNKDEKKIMWITTLACLLPVVLALVWYDKLPSQVPVHFDFRGQIDGYGSKWSAGIGFPLLMAGLNLILHKSIAVDPARRNQPAMIKRIAYWLIPVLSIAITCYSLSLGMGYEVHVFNIVQLFIALMFIIVGNYLPKCKKNKIIGFRLPWTLSSEAIWNRTHRMAGFVWVIGGIAMLFGTCIGGYDSVVPGILCAVIIFLPCIYSFLLYLKLQK